MVIKEKVSHKKKSTTDRKKEYSTKFKSTKKNLDEILKMAKEDIKKHPIEMTSIAFGAGYIFGMIKKYFEGHKKK